MKNRLKVISFLLSLSFFITMVCIGFTVSAGRFNSYLIAVPKLSGAGVPIKMIEEVNESKVMLTYENIYDKTVNALQSHYSVVLKGTSYTYPYVMNYSLTSGGFFSEEALKNKNKVTVINEKAAFDMFGTLNAAGNEIQIDMTPYVVTGVINDNDKDNLNVFIPAACLAESAGSIMTNLSRSNSLTEEYIKNELKHIGINELKYDFINLGLIIKTIKDTTFVSFEIILFGLLLIILKKLFKATIKKFKEIKQQQQQLYLKEMLKTETKPIQRFMFILAAAAGIIISEFLLVLNMFEKFLSWNSLNGIFNSINYTSFVTNVAQTERWYLLSNVLFIGFVIVFAIFMVTIWD